MRGHTISNGYARFTSRYDRIYPNNISRSRTTLTVDMDGDNMTNGGTIYMRLTDSLMNRRCRGHNVQRRFNRIAFSINNIPTRRHISTDMGEVYQQNKKLHKYLSMEDVTMN